MTERSFGKMSITSADRFHLVQNLRLAIDEQMGESGRATGRATLSEEGCAKADAQRHRAHLMHRKSREEIFAEIRALRDQGLSYCEIERRTGHKRRSVAKWLTFQTPPDRNRAALRPTSPRHFEQFLAERWKAGDRCGRRLFHDVRRRGYEGSFSNLERVAWSLASRGPCRGR